MSKSIPKPHFKRRERREKRSAPGTAPGTIRVDPEAQSTSIRLIACDQQRHIEKEIAEVNELNSVLGQWPMIWVDVTGLGSADTIHSIGRIFGLHALALEDVVNVHQRAKVDQFEDGLFVVARMVESANTNASEQISFFLRRGVLVTFQERPGDCWEPVRQRLRNGRSRSHGVGADYLMYSLLDSIVDSYFPAVDLISEQVDRLDEEVTVSPHALQIHQIHTLRGQLLGLRRAIRPHREMVNELIRDPHPLISDETRVFLRDCYDHVIQVIELVDTYRDLTADLRDFYMSTVSNKMNEIMKVLTIIATIFMPLSFIASVYGMNFDVDQPWNMPELKWPFGYVWALSLMLLTALGLISFFRYRRWF